MFVSVCVFVATRYCFGLVISRIHLLFLYFIVFSAFLIKIVMNTFHAASWSDPYSAVTSTIFLYSMRACLNGMFWQNDHYLANHEGILEKRVWYGGLVGNKWAGVLEIPFLVPVRPSSLSLRSGTEQRRREVV